jgi:hypothetical protein
LLPAGFLNCKSDNANSIFKETEIKIKKLICKYNQNLNVCLGIDGLNKKEQFSLAINQKGIIAVARKFYHMDDSVKIAASPFVYIPIHLDHRF